MWKGLWRGRVKVHRHRENMLGKFGRDYGSEHSGTNMFVNWSFIFEVYGFGGRSLEYITTSYWWLKSIFSEMILATLAGIRATNRNVNRLFSCLNLIIRRWELHHKNRLVALCTKIKFRRPNSLILMGTCRVWCEVDGFWKVFRAFLWPNFGFGSWDFARIEIF